MTNYTEYSLKNDFLTFIKGLYLVDFLKPFIPSLLITYLTIIFVPYFFSSQFLLEVANMVIQIYPTLIGYSLVSFSLIYMTIDKNSLKVFIKHALKKNEFSTILQNATSFYIFMLIIQFLVLITSVLIKLAVIDSTKKDEVGSDFYFNVLFFFAFIFSLLLLLFSFRLIFTFIQLKHVIDGTEKSDIEK